MRLLNELYEKTKQYFTDVSSLMYGELKDADYNLAFNPNNQIQVKIMTPNQSLIELILERDINQNYKAKTLELELKLPSVTIKYGK